MKTNTQIQHNHKRKDTKHSFNTKLCKLCVRIIGCKKKPVISTTKIIWKAAEEIFSKSNSQ